MPMEVTIHLGRSTMIAIILILGVIAFCTLYPMVMACQAPSAEPPPPEEPFMGFQPHR